MKIRSGFVSNSSSSSFVVAFARKPKNEEEVFETLFGKDTEGFVQLNNFTDVTPNKVVAERVFKDVKESKKATKKAIASEFSSRYFYLSGNENPYYRAEKYCSTNHPLMDELIKNENEADEVEKSLNEKISVLLEKNLGLKVPYAYIGGTNWKTRLPTTKKEIDDYTEYSKKLEKFKKTNKEYIKLENERNNIIREKWNKQDEIRNKLGLIDAGSFIKDNEGKFITILNYADDEGEGNLEHGNIFRKLPHVQISHH